MSKIEYKHRIELQKEEYDIIKSDYKNKTIDLFVHEYDIELNVVRKVLYAEII